MEFLHTAVGNAFRCVPWFIHGFFSCLLTPLMLREIIIDLNWCFTCKSYPFLKKYDDDDDDDNDNNYDVWTSGANVLYLYMSYLA